MDHIGNECNDMYHLLTLYLSSIKASWQWYDRDGLAAPINMDFSKITRANFAFFQITEDGYIYGTDVRPLVFPLSWWPIRKSNAPLFFYCNSPGPIQ